MDTTLITVASLAGVAAAALQWGAAHMGIVAKHKQAVATALSVGAGVVLAVVTGQTGTGDFFGAAVAALASGQAVYALVLTKVQPSPSVP